MQGLDNNGNYAATGVSRQDSWPASGNFLIKGFPQHYHASLIQSRPQRHTLGYSRGVGGVRHLAYTARFCGYK